MKTILFHGSGFLFFWYIGFLNGLDKNLLKEYNFFGYSGGAIAMSMFLNGVKSEDVVNYFLNYKKYNLINLLNNNYNILFDLLPDNCHELCNDKLNIIYRNLWNGLQIKNNFTTKKELIEYLEYSSRLPLTLYNIYNTILDWNIDPFYVNLDEIVDMEKNLDIHVNIDKKNGYLDFIKLKEDKYFYLKIDRYGYEFCKNNIIVKKNLFKLII